MGEREAARDGAGQDMNTAELLNEVTRRGIKLKPDGNALCYTAPKDLLTPELMAKLKAHKTELLDILRKPGAERIAQDHGLPLADLQQAAGPDWSDIENDPVTLEALARSITIRRMRERGEVPPDYTATTVCRHCGPVPIYPGVAERMLGCPWCFNRAKGLPMPKAPTKTQLQDLGPAMLKRDGCEGHKWSDYYPSEKALDE